MVRLRLYTRRILGRGDGFTGSDFLPPSPPQAMFDYLFFELLEGSNVKALSTSRVLKLAKLQKIFRLFRAFRTVKILSYILTGLDIIQRVYEMLYKIVICIPIVMRLSVIWVIVFYVYAAIGVEIFAMNIH